MKKDKSNRTYGKWTLNEYIGGGGNGEVWSCSSGQETRAIKLLKKTRQKPLQRFTDETTVLENNSDLTGIIPILDKNLSIVNNVPHYIMPVAISSIDRLRGQSLRVIVEELIKLTNTLELLHNRRIYHRDIKPSNILYLDGQICFTDFGLVDYPDKKDISKYNEEIGAKWTMAPEMRRESSRADYAKADIYSLAKTLWIYLTEKSKGFDGQYSSDSIISLKNKYKSSYTTPIDNLLTAATDNEPLRRPTVEEFRRILEEWLELDKKFYKKNIAQWFEIQSKLFPTSMPKTVRWKKTTEIVKVLNTVCSYENLNHMFLPDRGGMDLMGARASIEDGCIELDMSFKEIVKPKELIFESFGVEHYWNYFRLDLEELEDSGIYSTENGKAYNTEYDHETLSELLPGRYYRREILLDPEYHGNDYYISDNARTIVRRFRGSYVLFNKSSVYNRISSTYDGRHNKMSAEEFRTYIEGLIKETNAKGYIVEDKTESKIEIEFPIELTEQQIYRCGWCGNLVGEEGDELTEYMWNYYRALHQKYGEGLVSQKNGYCCRSKWSNSR